MPDNLTKRDIVLDIYQKTSYQQKEVKEVVQLTLDAIAHALSSDQQYLEGGLDEGGSRVAHL